MTDPVPDAYQAVFRALPQPGILCGLVRDSSGTVVDVEVLDLTDSGGEIIGMTPTDATGTRLVAFSGRATIGPLLPLMDQVEHSGEPVAMTVPAPNGRTYDATIARVGADRVVILALDVTDRQAAEAARHDAEERYRQAMAVVKDGVLIQDLEGRITAANPVAAEILGVGIEDLAGRTSTGHHRNVTGADGRPITDDQHPTMITLRTGQPCRDVVMSITRPDGRRIWLVVTTEPLRDSSAAVIGVMVSFTDVTEQIATGAELQSVQARYQTTLQQFRERDQALQQRTIELETARTVARLGFWRTDLRTAITVWSPELFMMGGLEPTTDGVVPQAMLDFAFPPDVAAARDQLVMKAIATDQPWELELHIEQPSGRDAWILTRGTIERDANGTPIAATGTALDITATKRAALALEASETALRERNAQLEEARLIAGLGTWKVDARTDTATWSPELFLMVGMEPGATLRPSELDAMTDPEAAAERTRMIWESAQTGEPFEQEYQLHLPNGRDPWFWIRGVAEKDETGMVWGASGITMDITVRKRAEMALRASEEALRRRTEELEEARDIAGLGIWRRDWSTGETTWSPWLARHFGFDGDGPVPSTDEIQALFGQASIRLLRAATERSARSGETIEVEVQVHRRDGEPRWVQMRVRADIDAHGTVTVVTGTLVDITERKIADLALRDSEEELRVRTAELEEARRIAGLGVWRQDLLEDRTWWSADMFRLFGLEPGDIPPAAGELERMMGARIAERLTALMLESASTGGTWEDEIRVVGADGMERWMLHRGVAEVDEDGNPVAIHGTAQDITERKVAELALRAREEELRQRTAELEEARRIARIGVWRVDMQTREASWSGELQDTFGIQPEEIRTLDQINGFFGPEGSEALRQATWESARSGLPWDLELPITRRDGARRWIQNRGVADMSPAGQPVAIHGTAMDITERKEAELALQASEERFRRVLDGLVEGALILDRAWRIVYVNRGFARATGSDPADDIGLPILELVPPLAESDVFRHFVRSMTEGISDRFEGSLERPGAPDEWWEFSVQPVPEGIFVLALDVTARHHAEAIITQRAQLERERTAQLEEAGRMARLGIWRRDVRTRTTTWSPEMYELFEVDPGESPLAPEAVDAMVTAETRATRDHVASTSIAAGVPWEVELELRFPDGHSRWVLQHGTAETDGHGAVLAYRGTALDITERKRTEAGLRRFSETLEQRVKERTAELEAANEELRSFSYTISHDLRAPVRAVAGFARILERDHGATLDERALHSLNNIKTAGEAMGRLIDDLLAYTRIGRSAVRREPVDVLAIARRLAATFGARVEERAGAIEVVEPMAIPIGDATLVEELLINLVDNALNYSRPDVPPHIRIASEELGAVVRLSVADNGVGIPAEQRERIFEVFTRLPGVGEDKGTGIGLAIVRKAARSMGSDVTIDSVVGEGTTFSVLLPSAEGWTADA